ncbi:MAG: hypothetical protein MK171_09990 [Pirellulales bacterium]|nr:hypothetical protein [Pirellulales bacterium]
MASKENQNLQIVVIVLTILVLILAGVSVWLNGNKNAAVARADAANQKASQAAKGERQVQTQANTFKQMMGFGEADEYGTVQEAFQEDMDRFGGTFAEESHSYQKILHSIFDENRQLEKNESAAKDRVKELKSLLLAIEKDKDDQIAEHVKAKNAAIAEQEALRNGFNTAREVMTKKSEEMAAELESQRDRINELTSKHAATEKALSDEVTKLERMVEICKSKLPAPDPYAQPADGEIRWVDQREGKVWINLGEGDQLRPQVTFSVYSGDARDIRASESKGSLEVTRLLSSHLAEARITADEPARPLAVGDKIFSQVWNRGRKVGFAVAGVIDLDGDGSQDMGQLKSVIAVNGGKVDALPDGKGSVDGEMSVDTRYLVLGNYPEGAHKDHDAARKSWDKMNADADALGIETITVDEFLGLLGWRADRKTVKLGPGAQPVDAPLGLRREKLPQNADSQRSKFRRREPSGAY